MGVLRLAAQPWEAQPQQWGRGTTSTIVRRVSGTCQGLGKKRLVRAGIDALLNPPRNLQVRVPFPPYPCLWVLVL